MKTYNIAYGGDLALIVSKKYRLLVSSVTLSTASTVFRAMFGPRFAEGKALREKTGSVPTPIVLSEDDPESMLLLCAALHMRNDLLPEIIKAQQLRGVATLADKYNCIRALTLTARHWLRMWYGPPVSKKDLVVLEAAYLFDHAQAFATITDTLSMRASHGLLQVLRRSFPKDGLYERIKESRLRTRMTLQRRIEKITAQAKECVKSCYHRLLEDDFDAIKFSRGSSSFSQREEVSKCIDEIVLTDLGELLRGEKDLPALGKAIRGLISPRENLVAREYGDAYSCHEIDMYHKFRLAVTKLKKTANDVFAGVCLDCFKARGTFEGECRFEHEDEDEDDDDEEDEDEYQSEYGVSFVDF